MSKIISIDYGLKRIGIAITDELKMFAFGLTTVSNFEIISFLTKTINGLLKFYQNNKRSLVCFIVKLSK